VKKKVNSKKMQGLGVRKANIAVQGKFAVQSKWDGLRTMIAGRERSYVNKYLYGKK
jgi:hypothetical protein